MHHRYMHHQQLESRINTSRIHASCTHLRGSHCLSSRRVRRTKSSRPKGPKAGLKGCKLEVGPRRGPRLLVVITILYFFYRFTILNFKMSIPCAAAYLGQKSLSMKLSLESQCEEHFYIDPESNPREAPCFES